MGSWGWVFGSDWSEEIQYEPVLLAVATTFTWIGLEYKSALNAQVDHETQNVSFISPHDEQLFNKLRSAFPEETRKFLREHGFGVPYNSASLKSLDIVYYDFKGVSHQFDDLDLQRSLEKLTQKIREFLVELGKCSGVADRWPDGYFSVPTDQERGSDNFSQKTVRSISKLEDEASDVLAEYEELERLVRSKYPQVFSK